MSRTGLKESRTQTLPGQSSFGVCFMLLTSAAGLCSVTQLGHPCCHQKVSSYIGSLMHLLVSPSGPFRSSISFTTFCVVAAAVRLYLNVIIEDQMLVLVALQQCVSILQLEVLKLQHRLGPSAHHCLYKLIQQLQQTQTLLLSQHVRADESHSQDKVAECSLMHLL